MMGDTATALIVAVVHVWLLKTTSALADRFGFGQSMSLRISAQLVFLWSVVVAAAALLTSVEMLSAASLYGAVTAIVTVSWLMLKNVGEQHTRVEGRRKIPVERSRHDAWLVVGLQALAAIGIAQVVCYGLLELPVDWDSLAYHLPLVDHWIQTGDLANQQCAFWYVPGNNELIAYWFAAPFSGDFWAQLNNVPIAILLVAAVLSTCEHLRLGSLAKLWAVVMVVSNQPVIRQIVSAENDIAVGALLLAAVLFGQRYAKGLRNADLVLHAMSVGLLCGVKYYALGYAAVAVAITVVSVWQRHGIVRSLRPAVAATIGFLAFGAYWYGRNYFLAGSPLFPLGFAPLGIPDQWADMRPESERSSLLVGSTIEVWRMLIWAWMAQAGPLSMIVTLSSPLFAAIGFTVLRSYRASWLPSVLALAIGVYFITPNVIETVTGSRNMLILQYHPVRFGFGFFMVAIMVAATMASRLSKASFWERNANLRKSLVVTCLVLAILGTVWAIVPQYGIRATVIRWGIHAWRFPHLEYHPAIWFGVTVVSLLIVRGMYLLWQKQSLDSLKLSALVSVLFTFATPILATRWHSTYDQHYDKVMRRDIDSKIRELAGDEPFAICEYRYYTSLGSFRQGNPYRPLFLPDYGVFTDYLRENGISLIAAPKQDDHWCRTYENVDSWMVNRPFAYELMYENRKCRIFRVKPPRQQ